MKSGTGAEPPTTPVVYAMRGREVHFVPSRGQSAPLEQRRNPRHLPPELQIERFRIL